MIAIELELLTGRYIATSYHDRNEPEWPPHPARLFSALVATMAEHDDIADAAGRALGWLECQGCPQVLASDAARRAVVTTYVPSNTGRVLGEWSNQEETLRTATAAAGEAVGSGDAKATRKAARAVDAAKKRLAEQIAKASADDGRYSPPAVAEALAMLPQHRSKQPRAFPSVTPLEPRVRFLWPDAAPDEHVRSALDDLARRVVRVGHSSSLVACRVVDEAVDRALNVQPWVAVPEGVAARPEQTLRTVDAGQLANLRRAHARHRGVEPRVLPARDTPYRRSGEDPATPRQSVFGDWLVFREVEGAEGRRLGLGLTRTEDLTRALRGAVLHHADDPPAGVLSGHAPDGSRLEQPHVAFVALADVGSTHAHGRVLGAAVLLPTTISAGDRGSVLRAVGRWEQAGLQLRMGRVGAMWLERVADDEARTTLQPEAWTRPSRRWGSVTPVALDENPGDLASRDPRAAAEAVENAERIVARACERIGLPAPAWVQVMRRSLFDAAPAARRFMPFPRHGGGFRRVCVHVELLFTRAVMGPVLLGAGRYFGLGLCRPS